MADGSRLLTWVHVGDEGTVSVRTGKAELGQGILTAIAQLAADELDVAPFDVRVLPASTALGPDEGFTAGSMSVAESGSAVRRACAQVRALFVTAAAEKLGVEPGEVTVQAGRFATAGRTGRTTYAELTGLVDLDVAVDPDVPVKDAAHLRLTGTELARLDLPDKVTGRPRFITDLRLPGQLMGRVVRPPSVAARLVDVDTAAVSELPGVRAVIRDGSFLGVVADDERACDRAADALRDAARWGESATLPDEDDLGSYLRAGPATTFTVDETEADAGDPQAVRQLSATYSRPFLAHASMSPSAGVAVWDDDGIRVWSHTQGIFPLRDAIAAALGLAAGQVTVEHAEGAGAYGHNGADDAAFDAVLLARAVPGRPVMVRWSRQDELAWSPFGSAMSIEITGGLDASGRLACWRSDIYSQGHTSRPGYAGSPGLLAAAHLEGGQPLPAPIDPPPQRGAGSARNAVPGYDIPARRIRGHRLDTVGLRTSSLRTLGTYGNIFAIESMIDELAEAVGHDPLEFRLANLRDDRGRAVLDSVARQSGWTDWARGVDTGLGIGYARYKAKGAYCAVVAEVEALHDIRVRRLWAAVDVGRVVNPDGVRNQIEGGAVQSTSWTLKERVCFDRHRVTSTDWESYPILRFSETPVVEVELLDRPELPSVGAGEASQGPTVAAIGNAVASALGVRVRDLPITADRVLAALGD